MMKPDHTAEFPVLRCERLSKRFGGVLALVSVDVIFDRPDIVAVVGPNGAGKTTLFDVITGFAHLDSGRVLLGNIDIGNLTPHSIARLGVTRTFQELRLVLRLSTIDNVMLAAPRQRGERLTRAITGWGVKADECANRANAQGWLAAVGLGEYADRPAGELSYGQQKLLTLAVCLATGTQIVLLDEPLAGVYGETVSDILELMKRLRDLGKLVVFIEHDIAAVSSVAHVVMVMAGGVVIAHGSVNEVLTRQAILDAYVR